MCFRVIYSQATRPGYFLGQISCGFPYNRDSVEILYPLLVEYFRKKGNRKDVRRKKIDAIKNKIVNAVSPEAIILFGSYAKGEYTEESDLDILVIWNSDFNPHKRNLFLSRLFPGRDFSLDIFAFTKNEAEKLKNIKGTILYEAFHHGKVIYGK